MYKIYVPRVLEGCVMTRKDMQNSSCLSNNDEMISKLIKRDLQIRILINLKSIFLNKIFAIFFFRETRE